MINISRPIPKADIWHRVPALVGVVAAIGVTLVLGLATCSPKGDLVAAAFPPWWDAAEAFEAAGTAGRIVGVGRFASVLIVRGERPGLADRLHGAGALFTFDAGAFGGCIGSNPKGET